MLFHFRGLRKCCARFQDSVWSNDDSVIQLKCGEEWCLVVWARDTESVRFRFHFFS